MPRKKAENEIVLVDELPNKGSGVAWTSILAPLLKHPHKWALIREFDSPQKAMDTRGNLHRRLVNIPKPDHDWVFAARGAELYACYKGPKRKKESSSARVRRNR